MSLDPVSERIAAEEAAEAASSPPPCSVPRALLEALLANTYELRGERYWWADEPRCGHQQDYEGYGDVIEQVETILKRSQGETRPWWSVTRAEVEAAIEHLRQQDDLR